MGKALKDYDFFDPEVIECPFDFYKAARPEAPVYQLPDTNIFFVSRYDDVKAALKRTPNWRLTEGKNTLTHWPNLILRGLNDLHISFDKC